MAIVLCFAGSAAADHTSVYRDPLGDVGIAAPDYTQIQAISGLSSTLLVGSQVANKTGFSLHDVYSVWLDTDGNASTPVGGLAVRGSEFLLRIVFPGDAVSVNVWDVADGAYVPTNLPAEVGFGAGPFVEIPFRRYGLAFGDRINFSLNSRNNDTGNTDIAPGGIDTYSFQIRRCDLEGTGGDDRLTSGAASHWICGFGGEDRLRGRGGDDLIYGGRGADRLKGGSGVDVLEGGRGSDNIRAGSGADYVYVKGGGADTVRCGPGFDEVEADAQDELFGCEDRF